MTWQPKETAPKDRRILAWCKFPAGEEARIVQWAAWMNSFVAYGCGQTIERWMEVPEFAQTPQPHVLSQTQGEEEITPADNPSPDTERRE